MGSIVGSTYITVAKSCPCVDFRFIGLVKLNDYFIVLLYLQNDLKVMKAASDEMSINDLMKALIEDKDAEIQQLQEKLETALTQHHGTTMAAENQDREEQLTGDIESLKESLATKTAEVDSLMTSLDSKTDEVNNVKKLLETKTAEIDELRASLETKNREVEDLALSLSAQSTQVSSCCQVDVYGSCTCINRHRKCLS